MANSKNYELLLRIGGKLDGSLTKSANNASKSLTSIKKNANLVKTAVTAALSFVGLRTAINYGKESVNLAKEQIDAETKLIAVLKNVKSIQAKGPEAYKQSAKALIEVATNLQKVGVIGDEVTLSGMQQLATFQLSDKHITMLSSGMTDLLAQQKGLNATQGDAVTIANMIGKAMHGNVGSLSRVGISFTKAQEKAIKTGNATQRAAAIAQVLKDNVGGVNAALAKTDQGQIQQVINDYGDMKETLGFKLLPIIAKVMKTFTNNLPQIESGFSKVTTVVVEAFNFIKSIGLPIATKIFDKFNSNLPKIQSGFKVAFGFAASIMKTAGSVASVFVDNIDLAVPRIQALVIGMTAYKLVMIATTVATKAGLIISALSKAWAVGSAVIGMLSSGARIATVAQWAFNAALAANPIGLAVIAVTALITGIVLLIQNFDKVKKFILGAWEALKNFFGTKGTVDLGDPTGGTVPIDIPAYARGTRYAKGGLSLVGEKGPELVNISRGSRVIDALQTRKTFQNEAFTPPKKGGGNEGGDAFTFAPKIIIQGNASKEEVKEALDTAQAEWERRMEIWSKNKRRVSFA